jgi:hypothetical protein
MERTFTTIAVKKSDREAIDILAEEYRRELHIDINTMQAVTLAVQECLERRGVKLEVKEAA